MVRKEFLELLRTDSAFREEVRRQILTDDLLTLPQKFDSLTELVAESLTILKELVGIVRTLAEAQQRTEAILQRHEEQIGEIIATQQRIFEILQRHEEQIGQLIEAQRGTEAQLRELVAAQQRTEAILQRHEEQIGEIIATQQRIFEILQRHEEQIGQLIEAQRGTEAQLRELVAAQQRTEAILQRHEEQIGQLIEAQRGTEAQLRELVAAQQRTEAILQRHEEQIGEIIATQQRIFEILQRHEEQIGEIIATQQRIFEILQRHEEQIGQLIEAQRQMEEQIRELVKAQQRTEEQLQKLVQWQQGEIGRQRGRDYEREIIRRAPILFQGGEGGSTEEFMVRQRLAEQLASILSEVPDDKDADPFLADLLWWKGDCVAVVEVSLQVNGYDVHRAAQRAATLRRAGLHVLPIVIGESWTGSDAQDAAISKKVEWKVGSDLSEGFIDFRRRAPRG